MARTLFPDVAKEGLFRISGSKKRQEELKELIDKEIIVDLNAGKFTPHDVASVLKQFLGELPEPLLTQALYDAFLQIAGKSKIVLFITVDYIKLDVTLMKLRAYQYYCDNFQNHEAGKLFYNKKLM